MKHLLAVLVFGFCSTLQAGAHGVERGAIKAELARVGLSQQLRNRIDQLIASRCSLEGASRFSARTKIFHRQVDQGIFDNTFVVQISVTFESGAAPADIIIEGIEYSNSHPDIESVEISSLRSSICR